MIGLLYSKYTLKQENAELISKEFNKLEVIPVKEFGTGVSFDKFVNVKP
ncbi:hypothetical protein [Pedobacter steynii]